MSSIAKRSKLPVTPSTKRSPLHVAELLAAILFFLSPHDLRLSALRVCRQWNKIARFLILARPVHWLEPPLGDYQEQLDVLRRLEFTHAFTFRDPRDGEYYGDSRQPPVIADSTAWVQLLGRLKELSATHRLAIKELVTLRPLLFTTQLIPILTTAGSLLTSLRMENLDYVDIPIDMMLAMCPRLMILHVHALSTTYYQDIFQHGKAQEYKRPELPSRLTLRSLTLSEIGIEEITLLRILARCPHLDELRLIQLLQSKGHTNTIDLPGPINEELVSFVKDSFLERVAELCPKLTSTLFSGRAGSPWVGESVNRIASTLNLFPSVRKWGFPAYNTSPATFIALRQHSVQDTLTTLEIVRPISSRDTCSESLHRYLCDSPHLLHLKAPDLPFSPLWFDIEGILDAKGSYRREKYGSVQTNSTQYEVVRRYVDPFHRRIWACRNLRTLYLKCSIETGDSYSQESALLIFGYLSKVCPRLQDLSLKRYLLNLSLEGGFCLLMRLTELRRLSIRINPEYLHKVLNVDWMSKAMTKKQRVKTAFVMAARSAISTTIIYATTPFKSTTSLPLPHSKHQAMNQSNTAAEHDNCDDDNTDNGSRSGISMHKGDSDASLSPDYMIDGVDMRNLGRWKDISDVLQDRLFNNWPCWPMLEHLEVELKKRDGDQTKEKIKHLLTTVRPEVEIAFNENWLFRAI